MQEQINESPADSRRCMDAEKHLGRNNSQQRLPTRLDTLPVATILAGERV